MGGYVAWQMERLKVPVLQTSYEEVLHIKNV